jgi:catechol 2,3-dioxygenase-like lactoylglutathione lyase family enzyme
MEWHSLHHVTGVIKANVDFYTQGLGIRLVKKTVKLLPYLDRRNER